MSGIHQWKFQSTLPIQGETCGSGSIAMPCSFQSTLPIQGETNRSERSCWIWCISIHSPYTGRDYIICYIQPVNNISIHSPYTGRDSSTKSNAVPWIVFQSTLPIQGETWHKVFSRLHISHFNPLSLYRERHVFQHLRFCALLHFNPLSLYRERRTDREDKPWQEYFNPLSLYRERLCTSYRFLEQRYFNPLSLYRERRIIELRLFYRIYFNPLSLYRERRELHYLQMR